MHVVYHINRALSWKGRVGLGTGRIRKRNLDAWSGECVRKRKRETKSEQYHHNSSEHFNNNWLVSWCFEPTQPQGITSGLKINLILSPSYSFHEPFCHKSSFSSNHYPNYIDNFGTQTHKISNTCLGAYFYSRAHSTLESASIVCNDEQGDLFYSAGPHRNWC